MDAFDELRAIRNDRRYAKALRKLHDRDEPLTWRLFAALRAEASRRWQVESFDRETDPEWLERHALEMAQETIVPVTFPAGSWVRERVQRSRAHRFSGDLSWRPQWDSIHLRAACGANLSMFFLAAVTPDAPDSACKRCLRSVGVRPSEVTSAASAASQP